MVTNFTELHPHSHSLREIFNVLDKCLPSFKTIIERLLQISASIQHFEFGRRYKFSLNGQGSRY